MKRNKAKKLTKIYSFKCEVLKKYIQAFVL